MKSHWPYTSVQFFARGLGRTAFCLNIVMKNTLVLAISYWGKTSCYCLWRGKRCSSLLSRCKLMISESAVKSFYILRGTFDAELGEQQLGEGMFLLHQFCYSFAIYWYRLIQNALWPTYLAKKLIRNVRLMRLHVVMLFK